MKEKIPGPGHYEKRPQTATTACTTNMNNNGTGSSGKEDGLKEREHYLNEVEYFANEAPGVGEYNLGNRGKSGTKDHVGVLVYPNRKAFL